MGRNRQSAFEDMIEVASFLKWWHALILAVLSYYIFHYFSQITIPPTSSLEQLSGVAWKTFFKSFATLSQYVAPMIFVGGAIISAVRQWKRGRVYNQQSSLDTIRNLSWQAFELLISEAFRRKGYQVSETQDGPDGGVDLIISKNGRTFFIQCKHWKKFKVGVKEVRELKGVAAAKGVYNGILVTSGVFTTDAIDFAETSGIELFDGKELVKLIPQIDQHDIQVEEKAESKNPLCPNCGETMVMRTARKGPNAGNQFWGCSKFPKCKGVINLNS